MSLPNDRDLIDWMFRDSGGIRVSDTAGAACWGHLDTVDVDVFDRAKVRGENHTLVVATGKLALVMDADITADGDEYTIRDHKRLNDGTTVILLQEA